MREADYKPFTAVLDQVCLVIGKGSYKPDSQATALWFRTLAPYDLNSVRAAFEAHVRDAQRGRFVPTPADIIEKIHANDGRVSADEAWAIATKASDESATVTWNDEIAEAWSRCKPVLDTGDKIGARMAFKDAYARITEAAKRAGKRVEWWPSLGHDQRGRAPEVQRAATAGLIGHDAPLALEMSGQAMIDSVPPAIRDKLLALRDKLTASIAEEKPEVTPPLPVSRKPDDVHGARGPDLLNLGVVGIKRREMGAA